MHKILYIITIQLLFVACNEKEVVDDVPSNINNVRSDSLPGQIVLRWDMPSNSETIHYIEVSYFDYLKQKNVVNLSSCDTLLIDKTRNKYGNYKFKLTPYSITRTPGETVEYEGVSGHAPVQEIILGEEKLIITEEQIDGNSIMDNNAQPPINLFDGDQSTIYHSIWSGTPPYPAWLSFNLKENISAFKINWGPRTDNSNGKPTDVDLMGSLNGSDWFLIVNLTKAKDGLPVTTKDWFRSPIYRSSKPFTYLKLSVNDTDGSPANKFWSMSELEIYKINTQIINPESIANKN